MARKGIMYAAQNSRERVLTAEVDGFGGVDAGRRVQWHLRGAPVLGRSDAPPHDCQT